LLVGGLKVKTPWSTGIIEGAAALSVPLAGDGDVATLVMDGRLEGPGVDVPSLIGTRASKS
jgi:hypothetical protein